MSTILSLLKLVEATNHLGERTYATWKGWRAAILKKHPDAWFDGDKDIASAMVGPKPYKRGETHQVGEWDGVEGSIHNLNEAKKPTIKALKLKIPSNATALLSLSNSKQHDAIFGEDEGDHSFMQNQDVLTVEYIDIKGDTVYVYPQWEDATEKHQMQMQRRFDKWAVNFKGLNEAKVTSIREPGFYVVDEDGAPVHGPFDSDRKAEREAAKLNGSKSRGYRMEYWNGKRWEDHTKVLSAMKESEDEDIKKVEAWKQSVNKAYPGKTFKFVSNVKDDTIEAIVRGEDRIYGIFDLATGKGEVLGD